MGTALEEARGCSSESGIMVLEEKPARKQGAPNRCCHRTIPTVSASSLDWIEDVKIEDGGGGRIDDADAWHGRCSCVVRRDRSFPELDRVSRHRAPGAGPGTLRPGLDHLRDLWTGQGGSAPPRLSGARGYHPLLAIAAGTGEVLMSRLREGRANTARGAAHFLRETVGRVRSTHRPTAASTPTLSLPPAGKWMSASLSPSASAPACET